MPDIKNQTKIEIKRKYFITEITPFDIKISEHVHNTCSTNMLCLKRLSTKKKIAVLLVEMK